MRAPTVVMQIQFLSQLVKSSMSAVSLKRWFHEINEKYTVFLHWYLIQDAIKQGNGMSNAGTYPGHADTILVAIGEEFDECSV
jgi:hypothetical protein